MSSEIMLSGGSFQVLLMLILVICISVFFFFEIRKINLRITSTEMMIDKLNDELKETESLGQKDINENTDIVFDPVADITTLNVPNIPTESTDIDPSKEFKTDQLFDINRDISGGFSPTSSLGPVITTTNTEDKNKLSVDDSSDKESQVSHDDSYNDSENDSQVSHDNSDNSSYESGLDIEEITKELQELSVKELKSILQEKELPLSGNKTTMIKRLIDSLK